MSLATRLATDRFQQTVTLAFHQNEVEGLRTCWNRDMRKLQRLQASHGELIEALEHFMVDAKERGALYLFDKPYWDILAHAKEAKG